MKMVSICVPLLNGRRYLPERLDTICGQSYKDMDIFVYDSFSDDGSWEYCMERAREDPRMRLVRGPREGVYPAWNQCIAQTTGEYVYFATADDTMALTCIEALVSALEGHPECDIAYCPLVIIDENGSKSVAEGWPECTSLKEGVGALLDGRHIRHAPFDGFMHLTGRHVIFSITQVLIRRSLFARVGEFTSRWGSSSDFNWEMKAGLLSNVIHVPDTWASWRKHPAQLTASVQAHTEEFQDRIDEMIEDALTFWRANLPPSQQIFLEAPWLRARGPLMRYGREMRKRKSSVARRVYQLRQILAGDRVVRREILGRLFRRPRWSTNVLPSVRGWFEKNGRVAIQRI